ncbi:MFS general substrate transporter [Pleomassaria siparia CBS 279.74]|uniref:MFS general substrate transporter n=1 Tax=Pleomassaria siparia CBS 279.74 TaxID=1314801 RepID=A0A6G1JQX9_9PLEO|nr:MFS general substrate transporter [Pleomassaria siparia CBS 279.74]
MSQASSSFCTGRSFAHSYQQVTWNGPNDPDNPLNWASRRKWTAATMVAVYSALAFLPSSMLAPSLSNISKDLHIGASTESQMVFSVYVLAWGIGPLILSPLSELYGRSLVLQVGNLCSVLLYITCAVSRTATQLIVFRFLSGLSGSAAVSVDDGMLTDLWTLDELGGVVGIYSLGPLIGSAIGPVLGGFITQYSTWKWAFYSLSITCGVTGIVGLFVVQETYGPRLLYLKAKRLRRTTGDIRYHSASCEESTSRKEKLWAGISRPLRMASTHFIVHAFALYTGYLYGVLYLFLGTFSQLWSTEYRLSISIGSLHFLSLALGLAIGSQLGIMFNDKVYQHFKNKNAGVGVPEFRIPVMIASSLFAPIGCLWYGWSAQAHLHWIMPDLGVMIFGIGGILSFQAVQAYVLEAYPQHGASAMAAVSITRALAGFTFPIFAPAFYNQLDYGRGNTVLASIALVLGIPGPILLYRYGAKLRARSRK